MIIRFEVPGEPRPRQSFRFATRDKKGRSLKYPIKYQPAGPAADWKSHVRTVAAEAMKGQPLFQGPLMLTISFVLPRPASRPKKYSLPDKKPDLDNLEKPVLDAMQGVVFVNDSQIVIKSVDKVYGDPPRLMVVVENFSSTSGE